MMGCCQVSLCLRLASLAFSALPFFFLLWLESWLTFLCFGDADEAELRELDEFVSQEEAFERALQESLSNGHGWAEPDATFSDADYDDIFMQLSEPAQDMDMS